MKENDSTLYEAFKAKDTRFDGRFFVGISSTKIYCRPVCWAKQAKKENWHLLFFRSGGRTGGISSMSAVQTGTRTGCVCHRRFFGSCTQGAKLIEESCGANPEFRTACQEIRMYLKTFAACFYGGISCYTDSIFANMPTITGKKSANRHKAVCTGSSYGGGVWKFAATK